MSTNYTNNYNLCQWEASDKVLRTDFNADNAKIDAALARWPTAPTPSKTPKSSRATTPAPTRKNSPSNSASAPGWSWSCTKP